MSVHALTCIYLKRAQHQKVYTKFQADLLHAKWKEGQPGFDSKLEFDERLADIREVHEKELAARRTKRETEAKSSKKRIKKQKQFHKNGGPKPTRNARLISSFAPAEWTLCPPHYETFWESVKRGGIRFTQGVHETEVITFSTRYSPRQKLTLYDPFTVSTTPKRSSVDQGVERKRTRNQEPARAMRSPTKARPYQGKRSGIRRACY